MMEVGTEIGIEGPHHLIVDPNTVPPSFCCEEHRREFLGALGPPPTLGWQTSPTCVKLRVQLERYEQFHRGKSPAKWLLSTRIARQIVEELRPLLTGPERETSCIEDLTGLFGVPVELVTDFPQGAVLR